MLGRKNISFYFSRPFGWPNNQINTKHIDWRKTILITHERGPIRIWNPRRIYTILSQGMGQGPGASKECGESNSQDDQTNVW